jgi:hypothetical protein
MGILDEVTSMKSRGISDSEVIKNLREQGISPSEINDALNRAQIKSAVSGNENSKTNSEGMEQSIMNSEEEPDHLPTEGDISDFELTPPQVTGFRGRLTKEIPENSEEMYEPQEAYYPQQQYAQTQEYAAPQPGYNQQEYLESMGNIDTDTIIEISEQVFSEKNKPLQKKIEEMDEFRVLTQTRVDYISDRLKKIETIIDNLQASILEKIGSYGHGIENVKKEMNMMQGSFSKMINNVADRSDEKYSRQNKSPSIEEDNSSDIPISNPKKAARRISKK